MYVVLLGLPGAGKGTQAARLKEETGLAHVTTGELFRENIRAGTELGEKAKPYVESGKLVPDELTIKMLLNRLQQDDCQSGCMFDGYPRNLDQARTLDAALKAEGKQIDRAVYIKVGAEELVSRLAGRWNCRQCGAVYHEVNQPPRTPRVCDKCGSELYQREDDKPEVVRTRMQVNLEQMEALVEYYRSQDKLVELDGQRPPDQVTRELTSLVRA